MGSASDAHTQSFTEYFNVLADSGENFVLTRSNNDPDH